MDLGEPTTDVGRAGLAALLQRPGDTLLCFDFDGTLAPIVSDPEQAYAHPEALTALRRVVGLVRAVAVITGRPVRTVQRLAGIDRDQWPGLVVAGQYGNERWEATTDQVRAEEEPAGIEPAEHAVRRTLAELDLDRARIEHKGRALGVHTRELPDPDEALARLTPPLTEIADEHDLQLEPGRHVLELRGKGKDKGDALREVLAETGATAVVFVGDDLGDLPAFETVRSLRSDGVAGLLVCSASAEQDALRDLADLVVDGPDGVAAWLTALAETLSAP